MANEVDAAAISAVLRQHLETEQALGLKEVPLPRTAAAPSTTAAHPVAVRPATPAVIRPAAGAAKATPIVEDGTPETAERAAALRQLDEGQVKGCTKCHLSRTRHNTVFGQGHAGARLVFVGEAPGADEDAQGLAFVGRAGQLLTKMIEAMGLTRDQVFICNVLKCRPPDNRTPSDDEIATCSPYLFEQIDIVSPEAIVTLGLPATKTLLGVSDSMGSLRARWHTFSAPSGRSIPVMPTYHRGSLRM